MNNEIMAWAKRCMRAKKNAAISKLEFWRGVDERKDMDLNKLEAERILYGIAEAAIDEKISREAAYEVKHA